MTTVLGFDFGLKRIGVASGQSITGTASPLSEIPARDGIPDWNIIGNLVAEWTPDMVLVGEPSNMDGTDSDMARRARKFANRIHGRFGVPVTMVDERLTSFEAKQMVRERYGNQDFGKYAVDSIAAVLIIEHWFASQGEVSSE
ncbi:Holliday junction DNA helicase RuvA [Hahella sp. CCB-MM4]|uniref:Holliday junction resolvase RuvX n=1 Tax=Hahella sp. (strain CCB-MM4) TaxID=1926491 RepID=UPI000B9AEE70|nr:Holliday junction resolvase RuvX [Hahella sp. CCB-MM4]OZG75145.1 Holliday junction DNA helicase RuvA [Hahella sp. CCB-MM4]